MTRVTIRETEAEGDGWRFDVAVEDARRTHAFRVTLAPADHRRWCRGAATPEQVVRAAFDFLLAHEPVTAILTEFDCSVIRRYFPDVDRELPRLLAAAGDAG